MGIVAEESSKEYNIYFYSNWPIHHIVLNIFNHLPSLSKTFKPIFWELISFIFCCTGLWRSGRQKGCRVFRFVLVINMSNLSAKDISHFPPFPMRRSDMPDHWRNFCWMPIISGNCPKYVKNIFHIPYTFLFIANIC